MLHLLRYRILKDINCNIIISISASYEFCTDNFQMILQVYELYTVSLYSNKLLGRLSIDYIRHRNKVQHLG